MMVQEFLEQIVKCLIVKNDKDETVFDWSGDYEKSFDQALSLPQEDFVLSVFYTDNDRISVMLWVKSDDRSQAKLIGIFSDNDFLNMCDSNRVVKMEFFNEQITIDGCVSLGVL